MANGRSKLVVDGSAEFAKLGKQRRLLICVAPAEPSDPASSTPAERPGTAVTNRSVPSVEIAAKVAKKVIQAGRANPAVAIGAVGVAGAAFAGVWAWKSWDSHRKDRAGVTYVSPSVAEDLDFPEGPFRPGVVYAQHPLMPHSYVRVCNLNLYVLQSRVGEYSKIMRSLGACEFGMEGTDDDSAELLGLSISLPVPAAAGPGNSPISAGLTGKASESAGISYHWRGPGGKATFDRGDSVWLAKDPTLSDIVSGRLEGRLTEAEVILRTESHLEIAPKIVDKLVTSKLDLGGRLRTTSSATFTMRVRFPYP